MVRASRSTGRSSCCSRRSRSSCSARRSASRFGGSPVLSRPADRRGCRRWSCSPRCCASRRRSRSGTTRASSTGCRNRKSCCWRPRSRRWPSQINPHFLFNTLTSISSLIRSQPETARMLIHQALGPAPPADAEPGALRHPARGARRRSTSTSTSRVIRFGPQLQRAEGDRPGDARRDRAEHDPAAARRELASSTGWRARSAAAASRSARAARDGAAVIEVVDDGHGMTQERLRRARSTSGIGLSNVSERLRVIYGAQLPAAAHSIAGRGTSRHASRFPTSSCRGAGHGLTTATSRASSSTTSSSPGRSCATCSTRWAASRSSAQAGNGLEALEASRPSSSPTWCFSTCRCPG